MRTKVINLLFRQWLFWMLFFAVQRAVFLVYYFPEARLEGAGIQELMMAFIHALKLDISTACYLLAIPFLLVLFEILIPAPFWRRANLGYNLILLLVALLVSTGELGIYKEWNSKLSYKALVYLQNPLEVVSSVKTSDLVIYLLMIFFQFVVFGFILRKMVYRKWDREQSSNRNVADIISLIVIPGLLFTGIRGGLGQIPITASQPYFSRHDILNIAAVNPLYNLAFNSLESWRMETSNHFQFMPMEEARKIVEQLHQVEKDTTLSVLKFDRPNVLILFLESWSGDLVESLGGKPGLTPQFHKLEKEGILFSQFFASGNRSQQALASVFSGLPALPLTTLTDHPEKYAAVPSMIHMLKDEGYYASFFFGGDLNYGNIKSFLVYSGFDRLVSEDDFPAWEVHGKLGYHDEVLFRKMLEDMKSQPRPFFTSALTLSSHSPYDQPGERPVTDVSFAAEYVNSAWYTDKWLGAFMDSLKMMPLYDSTLIFILSDHSHVSYNNYPWWSFNYRRIPLLITGGALREEYRGTVMERISSNTDLGSTLLKQLSLPDTAFFWSKDLFNPYAPQFAYFELNDGFGWKTPAGRLEYNVRVPMVLGTDLSKDEVPVLRKEGEAYIQLLFNEFLDY